MAAAGPDVQGPLALHPGQFGHRQDALVPVGHGAGFLRDYLEGARTGLDDASVPLIRG